MWDVPEVVFKKLTARADCDKGRFFGIGADNSGVVFRPLILPLAIEFAGDLRYCI
jgi:hypothetical protein